MFYNRRHVREDKKKWSGEEQRGKQFTSSSWQRGRLSLPLRQPWPLQA